MRAAGPAPAASRPALANDASSPLQSPADRVFWLAAAAVPGLPQLRLRDGRSPPPPHLDIQLIGRRGGTAPVHYQEHQCQTRNNEPGNEGGRIYDISIV